MSKLSQMEGTPWHAEKLTRKEGDSRRHKSRCNHYIKSNNYCQKILGKCIGSAHCRYYSEIYDFDNKKNKINKAKNNPPKEITFFTGARVYHKTFGFGNISLISDNTIDVKFDSGRKSSFRIYSCIYNKELTIVK